MPQDNVVLVHPGVGRGWWRGPWGWAVADERRVWLLCGERVHVVPARGVVQVGARGDGVVVSTARGALAVDLTTGEADAAPEDRTAWLDDEAGFVYRRWDGRTRAIDVWRPGERVQFGPRGAVLAGRGAFTRGGAPGRSPRPLPVALAPDGLRWGPDGQRVAGVTEAGAGVIVDLADGRDRQMDGVPVDLDAWRVGGRIVAAGGRPLRRGVVEASAAAWGAHLAGPGGWVWSLAGGARPVARRAGVALGATVGTPDGFVTVDWERGRGWTVGFDGVRRRPFALPLDRDDLVDGAVYAEGATWVETALGRTFRVVGGDVVEVDAGPEAPEPPEAVGLPGGPFAPTARAVVDGVVFLADDDGWLVSLPAA